MNHAHSAPTYPSPSRQALGLAGFATGVIDAIAPVRAAAFYGQRSQRAAVVALALAAASCTVLPRCGPGSADAVQDALYFGTTGPDGPVTDDVWAAFLAQTVTPRFPQGLTVIRASGQWRGADGSIGREPAYVLQVVHPDDAASERSMADIMAAYKTQFRQEAVLRVKVSACMSL
jgi:hypothetical protein